MLSKFILFIFKSLLALIFCLSGLFIFSNLTKAKCLEGQIDINEANQEEIEQLTGIGPTYAKRIIESRPYETVSDLINIKGIGEVTLRKINEQGLACVITEESGDEQDGQDEEEQEDEQDEQTTDEVAQESSDSSLNIAPIARAGDDIITNVGALIHFDGSASSDPDGENLTYFWNLGDGNFEKGASFDYTYFYPGEYLVVLEVFDGQWKDSDNIIVMVYPGKVYISELLPNPEGKDEEDEWIELCNISDEVINISGWQLDDEEGGSSPFIFLEHSFIAPNNYLVFRRSVTKIALNNNNDQARLLYPTGEIADEVSYEDAKTGYAAAKKGESFFWTELPTPGMQNLIFSEKTTKNLSQQDDKEIKEKLSGTSYYLSDAESKVALLRKRISRNLLINSPRHNVKLPTLADLDESFRIKEVFAQNDYLAQFAMNDLNSSIKKISLNKSKLTRTAGFNKIVRLKPKIILFSTTAISSILFGIWIVALKSRFFS